MNFSYNVRVIQAHPYFSVEPRQGIVPANGSVNFKIIFNPMTLGTCICKLQLALGKYVIHRNIMTTSVLDVVSMILTAFLHVTALGIGSSGKLNCCLQY